ncbi:MAG TPA: transposase [Vicinamibacterales bacterium]|nr:transposase [Vicinamibacterales bacterium]
MGEIRSCLNDDMSRPRRWFIPGISAHVIKRGNNRSSVFSRPEDYERFLRCLREAAARHATAVHAFVLMTNHVHLIATPEAEDSVPGFMKEVGERYSRYFNDTYSRSGTPWDGRYKAILLRDERYWLTCLRYVEQNPVRAGMVAQPEHYTWSSYLSHAFARSSDWLKPHPVFDALAPSATERATVYRRISNAALTDDEVRTLRSLKPLVRLPAASLASLGSHPGV